MRALETNVRSARLPGGSLINAVLDRTVMSLADRGGASNLIGARWADVAAEFADGWTKQMRQLPPDDGLDQHFLVERVVRLDDIPQIAALASKHGRQNPDLMLIGRFESRPVLQAADAKFSIETARAKQVSPAMVRGLLELGPVVTDVLGELDDDPLIVPGIFLTPDFLLTHRMLEHREGIVRATVKPHEVALVPVDPASFFAPFEGARAMRMLAAQDALPVSTDESLLAGLYYIRLARALIGSWVDANRPLLAFNDHLPVDETALIAELATRQLHADTAYQIVKQWNDDVEAVRSQRSHVDHVANLPLPNKELREQVERIAAAHGLVAPSANQVRRRLSAWYRVALRAEVGPVLPPVTDLVPVLTQIGVVGARLLPAVPAELERIVVGLGTPLPADGATSP